MLALMAVAAWVITAVALSRLTGRLNRLERENCMVTAQLHVTNPQITVPPRCSQ